MLSDAEVEEAQQWLRRNRYEPTRQLDGASFGDHLEEWSEGSRRVRLIKDRGQWFLEIGRDGWDDWFELDLASWVIGTKEGSVSGRLAATSNAEMEHLLPALREARKQRADVPQHNLPPRFPSDNDS